MNDLFEIRQTKDMGRGVFALKDIEEGVKVMDLDMREYLMYGVVVEHVFFGRLSEMGEINRKAQLGFYLAFADRYRRYQKHYSPKVIRYIDNLPHQYHSLICWQPHQLQMLANKSLAQRASHKRHSLYQYFLQIKNHLQQSDDQQFIANFQSDYRQQETHSYYAQKKKGLAVYNCSWMNNNDSDETEPDEQGEKLDIRGYKKLSGRVGFEEFLGFYSAIQTRRIYQQNSYDSHSELGALIPLAQLFNHSPSGQVIKDTYCIKTIKPIKKNQQIFITYGQRSNQQLFFNYGFIIDEDFDSIKNDYIPASLAQQKPQLQQQGDRQQLYLEVDRQQQHHDCKQQQQSYDCKQQQQQHQDSQQQYTIKKKSSLTISTQQTTLSITSHKLTQHRMELASKYDKYYYQQQGKFALFH